MRPSGMAFPPLPEETTWSDGYFPVVWKNNGTDYPVIARIMSLVPGDPGPIQFAFTGNKNPVQWHPAPSVFVPSSRRHEEVCMEIPRNKRNETKCFWHQFLDAPKIRQPCGCTHSKGQQRPKRTTTIATNDTLAPNVISTKSKHPFKNFISPRLGGSQESFSESNKTPTIYAGSTESNVKIKKSRPWLPEVRIKHYMLLVHSTIKQHCGR